MIKDEILEGNKLIAEFYKDCKYIQDPRSNILYKCVADGYFKAPRSNESNCKYTNFRVANEYTLGYLINLNDLKFHSSWDWLIPVIDKIYSMNEYIKYKDYMNNIICDGGIDINTKFIQITFSDVVEFIKWYNNKINK